MKLTGRLIASIFALVTTSTLSTSASAEPTIAELLARVSESSRRVTESALKVAEARARYDAQLDKVRAAAAEVLRSFATDEAAERAPAPGPRLRSLLLPSPATPRPTSILRSLTLAPEPPARTSILRSLELGAAKQRDTIIRSLLLTPTPKPIVLMHPALLGATAPKALPFVKQPLALRALDPRGTSIYDSLTFAKK